MASIKKLFNVFLLFTLAYGFANTQAMDEAGPSGSSSVIEDSRKNFSQSTQELLNNVKAAGFPKDFKWGFAIAEYQNSGAENCPNSNWARWEETLKSGKPTIKDGQKSGNACNHWNKLARDIKYMKEIGTNSLRFSIAWDRIEPKPGEFDQEAIDHYINFVDHLIEAGIDPMITFLHFVTPIWFEDLGGFEKEENVKFFKRFCKKMFKVFGSKCHLYNVINEPNIYMFMGYLMGKFPPGKTMNIPAALRVMRNQLKAHTEIYLALKKMPYGDKAQIGFCHQYLQFRPYSCWNPLERVLCPFNYLLNDIVLDFLRTGEFKPLKYVNSRFDYKAPTNKIADFFGLNYYSRVLVRFNFKEILTPSCYSGEVMTDMPYALYPQGFENAIKDVANIGLPIYITENGIADIKDNKRELFFNDYIGKLADLVSKSPIKGYYGWTFMDNFEWDMGYSMRFGLVSFNPTTGETAMRDSAYIYKAIIEAAQA